MIAIASPIALPTPCTTEVITPLRAARSDTLKYVSIRVAPSASDASSYSGGTARSAVSDTLTMYGSIITASTSIAASRHAPLDSPKALWIPGTRTVIPTKPYTTDGIPASSPTAELITEAMRGGAIFAINIAVSSPSGTPSTIAPAVPYTLVRINGRIPNCSVPELHVSPKRKSMIPT